MADSALVKKWNDYAANGGHLIITCRTATKIARVISGKQKQRRQYQG